VRDAVDADVKGQKKSPVDDGALSIDDMLSARLIDELRMLDLNTLSPYECMNLLFEWKKQYR